nr:MAG TPA: hypothetical protein [Caudoviricetes sp.]
MGVAFLFSKFIKIKQKYGIFRIFYFITCISTDLKLSTGLLNLSS